MCGIAGIVRFDQPSAASLPRAAALRDRLRHRGPDGQGIFTGKHAVLAHTRLALIDAAGGGQPMTSPDGRYTVVHNGEIYNFVELRRELAGKWQFATDSDTEVVLAAYARWGADCLPWLNGMFAFFAWDEQLEQGLAARDLLGIKPLAYAVEGPALVFASEAQAIVGTRDRPPRAALEPLLEYLVAPFFSGVERPMFAGVNYLQPGHALHVSRMGIEVTRWGDYDLLGPWDDRAEQLAPEIAERLGQAVKRCLIAEAPVGVFLSGGLDSTLLVAHAVKAGLNRPRTWTIRFTDQDRFDHGTSSIVKSDDTPFAEQASRQFNCRHSLVDVDRRTLADDLAAIAVINDALPAWEQELAQYHLSRVASHGVKAVLVGDAADETHYGYSFLLDDEATATPAAIVSRLGGAPIRQDLLHDPIGYFDDKYRRLCQSHGHGWRTSLGRTLATTQLIVSRWLPRLLHNGDIHSMAWSLEARVPFGDLDLLQTTLWVDPGLALRGGVEKWLLRESARGLVPEAIRTRPKSALPKDPGVAAIYQQEARKALARCRDFLYSLLDLDRIERLCEDGHVLGEWQRALLFRVIVLAHWQAHHQVEPP